MVDVAGPSNLTLPPPPTIAGTTTSSEPLPGPPTARPAAPPGQLLYRIHSTVCRTLRCMDSYGFTRITQSMPVCDMVNEFRNVRWGMGSCCIAAFNTLAL